MAVKTASTADAFESTTSSVAFTLRRSGRQWLNIAPFVRFIFAASTMKCLCASRIGFSSAHRPKYVSFASGASRSSKRIPATTRQRARSPSASRSRRSFGSELQAQEQ